MVYKFTHTHVYQVRILINPCGTADRWHTIPLPDLPALCTVHNLQHSPARPNLERPGSMPSPVGRDNEAVIESFVEFHHGWMDFKWSVLTPPWRFFSKSFRSSFLVKKTAKMQLWATSASVHSFCGWKLKCPKGVSSNIAWQEPMHLCRQAKQLPWSIVWMFWTQLG